MWGSHGEPLQEGVGAHTCTVVRVHALRSLVFSAKHPTNVLGGVQQLQQARRTCQESAQRGWLPGQRALGLQASAQAWHVQKSPVRPYLWVSPIGCNGTSE